MTKEMGRASIRQACGAKGLLLKLPMRLQARSPQNGPVGFAPDSLKGRSRAPGEVEPHGFQVARHLKGWRGRPAGGEKPPEAEALAEPRKSLTRCHMQTWPHGCREAQHETRCRPNTRFLKDGLLMGERKPGT